MKKIIILFSVILYALTPQEYLKIGSQNAIYDAANEYYKMKNYKKAIELYKKITKPSLKFKALYNLGNAYARSMQFQKAINSYKKALKIKKDKDALYNLKLIEKLLKQKKHNKTKSNKKQTKPKKSNRNNNLNKNNKKNRNRNKNNHSKKEKKKNKNNKLKNKNNKKNTTRMHNNKEKIKKIIKIKESNTTDIRKRYYMHQLKEMNFNTLLLPLRSQK